MSSLDRFTGIGIGDISQADQASDYAASFAKNVQDAFKAKEAKANEFKDSILDNLEGELFRKPIEDLTTKGFSKMGNGVNKVLRQGAKYAKAKIVGQPEEAPTEPQWSTNFTNPAFSPEEASEALSEEAAPTVARTPREVPEFVEGLKKPGPVGVSTPEERLRYARQVRDNARAIRLQAQQKLGNQEVQGGEGNPTDSGAGDAESGAGEGAGGSGIGEDRPSGSGASLEQGEEDAANVLTKTGEEGAGLGAEEAGIIGAGGGPEDIFADIAAIGLAIGTAFATHSNHEAMPPKVPSLSASAQFGI